ncbi:MAG: chromate resistance protein [Desulfobacteraceae bacterium]|nr:chromate resistance protein [Desulfobacteraceae bacterium]
MMIKKIYISLLLISLFISGYLCPSWISSAGASDSAIYTTWENMEIDKCACAWLIKRFIDKNASFKFVPKGTLITEGIPFDVPEAEIRRYHNMSAFEYLIKKHKINEPVLQKLGKIIHDIEINYWGNKNFTESQKIADTIQETIRTSETAEETLRKCFIFFDNLYSDNSGGKK